MNDSDIDKFVKTRGVSLAIYDFFLLSNRSKPMTTIVPENKYNLFLDNARVGLSLSTFSFQRILKVFMICLTKNCGIDQVRPTGKL